MKDNIMMNDGFKNRFIWDSIEAEIATSGKANCVWKGYKIVIDSRKVKQGDIFVALKGENSDGHDFVEEAIKSGACAVVVSRSTSDFPSLIVKDTKQALVDMAIYRRKKYQNKIICLTGSCGKTTTKEMLLRSFTACNKTYANEGNFNNYLGMPISLANLEYECKYAILEIGMSHPGEIAYLSNIAKPDIAIITNIGPAHLQQFKSVDDIACEKSSIFQYLKEKGHAIINTDCKYGNFLISLARDYGVQNIITYGSSSDCQSRILDYKETENESFVVAQILGEKIEYKLNSTGKFFAINSIACLSAVKLAEADIIKAAKALSDFSPLEGRGKIHKINLNDFNFHLIDDSYNSNPCSMKASLDRLISKNAKRKIAILGDMNDLGKNSLEFHLDLKDQIEKNNILVIAFGEKIYSLYKALDKKNRLAFFSNMSELCTTVTNFLANDDLVLVKASNSIKLYDLVNHILNLNNQYK